MEVMPQPLFEEKFDYERFLACHHGGLILPSQDVKGQLYTQSD